MHRLQTEICSAAFVLEVEYANNNKVQCISDRLSLSLLLERFAFQLFTDGLGPEPFRITDNGARQLYKNISMLFLFPVKDGKLSTGVNATFNASCYG